MASWSEMKAAVAAQMHRDPQRATLSTRAWQEVEHGLQHLASIGWGFEIAPKGTLGELTQIKESEDGGSRPLSIADAVDLVAPPISPMISKFEAMIGD